MTSLRVHLVGAGAVGLAYGYLLSARGHSVTHSSVRGWSAPAIPVRACVSGQSSQAVYAPSFVPAGDLETDLTIFAASPETVGDYLLANKEATRGGGLRFIFASVMEADWADRFARWPEFDPLLIFPLISCEFDPSQGLSLMTDLGVEFLPRCDSSTVAESRRGALAAAGLHPGEQVRIGRFVARYLLTASVYAPLLAVSLGLVRRDKITGGLLADLFGELCYRQNEHRPQLELDVPASARSGLEEAAALIRGSKRREGDILADNIDFLIAKGSRKLTSHLQPLRRLWAGPAEGEAAQLMSRVIART